MDRLSILLARLPLLMALVIFASPVFAESVSVAGQSITLEPPSGYCKVSKSSRERPVVESLEKAAGKNNVVLMVFAQCDELKSFREGKSKYFKRYGQYVAPANSEGAVAPQPAGVTRPQFVAEMTKNIQRANPGPSAPLKADKSIRRYPEIHKGEVKTLGLLDSDANAIYVGSLQSFKATSGDQLKLASVAAMTLVNGIVVGTDLFEVYTAQPNIDGMLGQQVANISSLVGMNK